MKKDWFLPSLRAFFARRWRLLLAVAAVSFCLGAVLGEILKYR